jgi:PIN domain nuclease of toxin-antitoxin system
MGGVAPDTPLANTPLASTPLGDTPLVVDTVTWLFWHAGSPRLSATARALLRQALHRPVYISVVSAFEIATKHRLGKLAVPPALLDDFAYVVESDGFRVLPVEAAASVRAGVLPGEHRDPFDRLLAAQALELGATVVSPDPAFAVLGVPVVW